MNLSMTANKLKIVTLATLFNLLFEYAVGGVERIFDKPLTIVFLALIYVSLFAMLEDLIRRFKLGNAQISVFAICFGILPELYLTGSIFPEPLILGINWPAFLTINIVWWGMLQSLVTLYFANRLAPRKWEGKYMGWLGWGLCIAYMAVLCAGSWFNSPTLQRGPVQGYVIATLFQLAGAAYLVFSIRRSDRESYALKPHIVLDGIAFGTVIVFIGIGTFVAGIGASRQAGMMLEGNALLYSTIWSFVVLGGAVLYYIIERERITA